MVFILDPLTIVFNIIALIAGGVAIYYFIEIYNKFQKGPQAWLLLAVTSIFLISTALIPTLLQVYNLFVLELMMLMITLWVAIYTSFFAGAGFVLYLAFVRVPKASLGKYLTEGFDFKEPVPKMGVKKELPVEAKYRLFIYNKKERFEDVIIQNVNMALDSGKNCLLITSKPQVEAYNYYLKDLIDNNYITLIEITKKEKKEGKRVKKVPLSQIKDINYLIEEVPPNSMIILDSMELFTEILSKEEFQTYLFEFTEKIGHGMELVVTVDKNNPYLEFLKDLFISIYSIEEDNITPLKGYEGNKGRIENYIDYKLFPLR